MSIRTRLSFAMVLVGTLATIPAAAGGIRHASRHGRPTAVVRILRGNHFGTRIFPDNFFTVRDRRQVTNRRVNFRLGHDYPQVGSRIARNCNAGDYSICDAFAEMNKLDGFDVEPRVTVPLSGAVNLASINDRNFYIANLRGHLVAGLRQVTYDPGSRTLSGISNGFLLENATYRIHVTNAIRDTRGRRINACGRACVTTFTTRTASGELVRIRQALDLPVASRASAYAQAGFPDAAHSTASRQLNFTQNGTPDVFSAACVAPSVSGALNGITRTDQVMTDPHAPGAFRSSAVPNLIAPGNAGFYAFGSFLSPRYQYVSANGHHDQSYAGRGDHLTDGEIPPVPTRVTPKPFGYDRLGAILVTPDPMKFPPPWPVAVYGPGFTRSDYDIFVSADLNASDGIATVATDPSGHGYGSGSTATVNCAGKSTTFSSFGRGRDLDGDGKIGNGLNDGVGPTGHFTTGVPELPSHKPLDGLSSGLIQTVVDNMALGRALAAGLNVPGIGTNLADPHRIYYYGISFGGIYGTMLMGTDPLFHRGLMNVPGGPILDIARLSGFRGDLGAQLGRSRPSLLNGGPGLNGFTEDLPEPRSTATQVITHPGAELIQELFGEANWFERSGSPETFAPRLRLRPDPAWAHDPKDFAFQTAYGDGTVPNPTAGTLYHAGQVFDRVTYYRNDKTPTYASDPHGWLADPTLAGRESGQQQLAAFLSTGQLTNPNPAFLEVPIANSNNLECLHYPDPQMGQAQARAPYPQSGDCAP